MDTVNERVRFSYTFKDEDDGMIHKVISLKEKDSVTASEICEMFLDFMKAAGYSEENIFEYFKINY